MSREIEADRLELVAQAVHGRPIGDLRQGHARGRHAAVVAEQAGLGGVPLVGGQIGVTHETLGTFVNLPAIGVQAVESTGTGKVFDLPLVNLTHVEALGEIPQVAERTAGLALGGERLHRRLADVLDGRQGIADGGPATALLALVLVPLFDAEVRARPIYVRRQQRDPQAAQLLAELVQLVGVAQVVGHRGGHELDRMVGLQIGRLERDQGIGGGVAFHEAVSGEFGHLFEDLLGLGLADAARHGAVDEGLSLRLHFRLDLLAHGPAEQVGAAQAVAGQFLGDLHHLFLIDHDAVGLAQNAFQRRIEVVRRLLAVLAGDKAVDIVHRAGAVERHHRYDVLEAVGPETPQHVAHARPFQLEHPHGLAPAQHLVGRRIVERHLLQIEVRLFQADQVARPGQHRQRLQAEEVELHQAGLLDELHAELGRRHVRARIAVERDQFVERPVADHHAGGVGRGVAVEPFQLERHIEQPRDRLVMGARLLELGLAVDGLLQADRIGRIVGHHLAQPVDQGIGHLENPPHVAQGGARLQLAEGDDLRHVVLAVLVLHVTDHRVALVLAEVDVEVRHRHALRVEEALEQQAPT